jgi:hypothetical protein
MTFEEGPLRTVETEDVSISYRELRGPLDALEKGCVTHGLEMVSPAILGYVRDIALLSHSNAFNLAPFMFFCKTNMDVFYDDRDDGQVVLIRDAVLSRLFLHDAIEAHKKEKEFVIPKNKRESVYETVDSMLENGRAFATIHGTHKIGENDLTNFIFSDDSLGISGADYDKWIKDRRMETQPPILFHTEDYAKSQRGPYLGRLHDFGIDRYFWICGDGKFHELDNTLAVLIQKTAKGDKS